MPKSKHSILPVSAIKEGAILIADACFPCLAEGDQRKVLHDRDPELRHAGGKGAICKTQITKRTRLYVLCAEGRHYLDGQLCEGRKYGRKSQHYVGFFLKS